MDGATRSGTSAGVSGTAETDERPSPRIPCPFVYANGRGCTGHVVRVEAYKADITWEMGQDGTWSFDFRPRSHFHISVRRKGTMPVSAVRIRTR